MTDLRAHPFIARLRADERGAALVEFALVAPIFLTLLMGVIQVGLHVQNTNSVRNLASDAARYTVVQYQRGNKLTTDQIAMAVRARGVGPRYNLNTDRLNVTVTEPASRIGGVREMRIALSYDLPDYLAFVNTGALQISYVRPVFLINS
jgi:Flp pilus assembly protein TadG